MTLVINQIDSAIKELNEYIEELENRLGINETRDPEAHNELIADVLLREVDVEILQEGLSVARSNLCRLEDIKDLLSHGEVLDSTQALFLDNFVY